MPIEFDRHRHGISKLCADYLRLHGADATQKDVASEIVRQWHLKFNLTIHEAYGMTDMIISGGLNVYPTEVEEILF